MNVRDVLKNLLAMAELGTRSTSLSPKVFDKVVKYLRVNKSLGAAFGCDENGKVQKILLGTITITELNARIAELKK